MPEYATVRNTNDSSVVFIRNSERIDTGKYQISVQVEDLVASAIIDVAVVDIPSKPRKATIVEVIGSSVQLSWEAPKDNGNCDISGYSVEKRDKRSGTDGEWYIVYDKVRSATFLQVLQFLQVLLFLQILHFLHILLFSASF